MRVDTDYCPGNGTRYQFVLAELPASGWYQRGTQLFVWLNADRNGGRSMVLPPGVLDRGYLADKLGGPMDGDFDAICEWLRIEGCDVRPRCAPLVEWTSAQCPKCGTWYSYPPDTPDPGPPVHACLVDQ